jgi:transposase-like protein
MKARRPEFKCDCPASSRCWSRHGRFYRTSDSRWIFRWKCRGCGKTSSQATLHPCFRQLKRRVNYPLLGMLCSGVSLRRSARLLRVSRTTVDRKFRFLAEQCRKHQAAFLKQFEENTFSEVVFDEMETFEHSKCKPVSIAIAVSTDRKILAYQTAKMPAKGPLAAIARKKYGFRKDERPVALKRMLENLLPVTQPNALMRSDQNPSYPRILRTVFPQATHETTKGGRGAITGQGELKKLLWDPIFCLNHTAAMLRANMNRLFRRTWCTTKAIARLNDHLALYVHYHNTILLNG